MTSAKLPPGVTPPRAANIYSGKGKCSTAFDTLLQHPDVSTATSNGTRELHNVAIGTALKVADDMPALFDRLYTELPLAYNRNGGSFGLLRAVASAKNLRTKQTAPFGKQPVSYRYPDGFIVPLAYGLRALLEPDAAGHLAWTAEPFHFVDQHLD